MTKHNKMALTLAAILLTTAILTPLIPATTIHANTTITRTNDLLITEYIEGDMNDKAIELTNLTGKTLDLSQYKLQLYPNGTNTPNPDYATSLTGTLKHAQTYTLANSNTNNPQILAKTNQRTGTPTTGALAYNGDDALVLLKYNPRDPDHWTPIDHIGQPGLDPGNAWTSKDGTTTLNTTLTRKSTTTKGSCIDPQLLYSEQFTKPASTLHTPETYDIGAEWTSHPMNATNEDTTHLGTHPDEENPITWLQVENTNNPPTPPVPQPILGRLFAGWYKTPDEQNRNPGSAILYDGTPQPATIHARYIDQRTLQVLAQVAGPTTDEQGNNHYDLRLISSTESLQYQQAGFLISLTDKEPNPELPGTRTLPATSVYTTLQYAGGSYTPRDFQALTNNTETAYLFAVTLRGIPATLLRDDALIYIRPYLITYDGQTTYGETYYKTLTGRTGLALEL